MTAVVYFNANSHIQFQTVSTVVQTAQSYLQRVRTQRYQHTLAGGWRQLEREVEKR